MMKPSLLNTPFQLRKNYNHAVELKHQLEKAGWTDERAAIILIGPLCVLLLFFLFKANREYLEESCSQALP